MVGLYIAYFMYVVEPEISWPPKFRLGDAPATQCLTVNIACKILKWLCTFYIFILLSLLFMNTSAAMVRLPYPCHFFFVEA